MFANQICFLTSTNKTGQIFPQDLSLRVPGNLLHKVDASLQLLVLIHLGQEILFSTQTKNSPFHPPAFADLWHSPDQQKGDHDWKEDWSEKCHLS